MFDKRELNFYNQQFEYNFFIKTLLTCCFQLQYQQKVRQHPVLTTSVKIACVQKIMFLTFEKLK